MRSTLVVGTLVAVALGWSARAHADEDHAAADKLFEEAQALKQAGKTDEACKKYDEALARNRNAVGTLLNVGKCNEDSGRIATAIKHYTHARDLAREHKLDEHRTAAEQRIDAISARVPQLAIEFTERLDGMKLVIDDVVYPTDEKSVNELRLDPGSRHIVVTAPGRLPYSTDVALVEGKQHAVAIPTLGRPITVSKGRRTVGQILTFSGLALGVTGIALGYLANLRYEDDVGPPGSGKPCIQEPGQPPMCDAESYQRTGSARQLGWVGTFVGVAGVAAMGLGVALWLTAPSEVAQQVTVLPTVTNDSAGIAAVGRF